MRLPPSEAATLPARRAAAPGTTGWEKSSGLTETIGDTDRVLLISIFFTLLESLPMQPARLEAALATGPTEL